METYATYLAYLPSLASLACQRAKYMCMYSTYLPT